ncbi:MAG: sugar ABC transporter permease [Armatimonadetes bacterium]|nr:sugar ABC transporter permease [Armatimonadota bacterium]
MNKSQWRTAAMFLMPYGVVFGIFVLLPVLYGFYISLHKWHILAPKPEFIGLRNYKLVLSDDLFRIAFARTAFYVAMVVPLGNALSLLLAVGLNQNYRGTTFYKVAFYLPVVMSVSVIAILWRWLYSAEFGIINHYLSQIASLGHQIAPAISPAALKPQWLNSPATAMPAIALMSIWWGAGGNMLIYFAGLKNVPRELLEAAEIDGAGPWRRFWTVSWPLLRPTTLFCLVMSVIASFQVFGQTYILTGGGPYYSTLTIILYMYQQGFGLYQLGYAAAVGYLLFGTLLICTLIQFKLLAVKQ